MSFKKIATNELQPSSFSFSLENLELARMHIAKYPDQKEKSAVMPLLDLVQKQHDNWIPMKAIEYVGEMINMPAINVLEIASFYSMYNLSPVGKYHIQLCGTTPCWLRGSDKIKEICISKLAIKLGEVTSDGVFSLTEVECLGACANAPMMQINNDYYEDLNADNAAALIDKLAKGEQVKTGSQIGRISSESKIDK